MNKCVFFACLSLVAQLAADGATTTCLARPLMGNNWCEKLRADGACSGDTWCVARCAGPMALNQGKGVLQDSWLKPETGFGNCVKDWAGPEGGSGFDQTVAVRDYLAPTPPEVARYILEACQRRNSDGFWWAPCFYALARPIVAGCKLADYWSACMNLPFMREDGCANGWVNTVWSASNNDPWQGLMRTDLARNGCTFNAPGRTTVSALGRCMNSNFAGDMLNGNSGVDGAETGCLDACMDLADQASIDACVTKFKTLWIHEAYSYGKIGNWADSVRDVVSDYVWKYFHIGGGWFSSSGAVPYALWQTRGPCAGIDAINPDGTSTVPGGSKTFWDCVQCSISDPKHLPWPNAANSWNGGSNWCGIKTTLDNKLLDDTFYQTWAGYLVSLEQLRSFLKELLGLQGTQNFLKSGSFCTGPLNDVTNAFKGATPPIGEEAVAIDLSNLLPYSDSLELFKAVAQKYADLSFALRYIVTCANFHLGTMIDVTGTTSLDDLGRVENNIKSLLSNWGSWSSPTNFWENYQNILGGAARTIQSTLSNAMGTWTDVTAPGNGCGNIKKCCCSAGVTAGQSVLASQQNSIPQKTRPMGILEQTGSGCQ